MKLRALPAMVIFGLLPHLGWSQNKTYLALGDSVAWGYQPNDTSRGPGDKGYVKIVADWLTTIQGGTRPKLINLAIPGESTASFYDTSEIGGLLNSNYPVIFRKSQSGLFVDKVNAELASGRQITNVTFALGANDLLDLQTSQFLAMPLDQQKAIVDSTLVAANTKLTQEFTLIRQYCPTSKLTIIGYYNPYGAYPGSAEELISTYAIPKLNALLARQAKHFGGFFQSVYPLFVGNELNLTWIADNDVHPKQSGYNLIGQAVIGRIVTNVGQIPPGS